MNVVDNGNTRGYHRPQNVNPWVSGDRTQMVMSRSMAAAQGFEILFDPDA
jgi:hypothetical protein